MKLSTAFSLAAPHSAADRGRFTLIALATAIAGALLLAAAHVVRLPTGSEQSGGLAAYVTESRLRGGVVLAVLLLNVPVLALALQALRIGVVAIPRIDVRNELGELGLRAITIAGLLIAVFAAGPRLVLAGGGLLARRGGAEALLAQRRMRADARSAGRVAGVLLVCGIALGVIALLAVQTATLEFGGNPAFYVTGYAMTRTVVLVAAALSLAGVSHLAARLLRPLIRAATDPENLRVA